MTCRKLKGSVSAESVKFRNVPKGKKRDDYVIRKVPQHYGKKTSIVTKFVSFHNFTEKESPKKGRGVFSKNRGANCNQAHLGLPRGSSRRQLLLEEAT